MFENFPTFVTKILYSILFIAIIYVIIEYIIGRILFSPFTRWWKENDGDENYKGLINFTAFGLFNQNKLVFDIYQEFFNREQLNEVSINFIQNILLNKTYAIDQTTGNILPGRFLKPSHLCSSIAWGSDDEYLWNFNVDLSGYKNTTWYKWICNKNPTTGYDCYPPQPDDYNWSGCSYCGNESPDPVNLLPSVKNTFTDSKDGGGFWPHQYGCIDFFDIPGLASGQDDIDLKSYEFQRYDLVNNLPCVNQNMYVPGYPGHRGSWAQLFADWGIVYTIKNTQGTSSIPVLSDGLSCDNLFPCTTYCNPDITTGSCPKPTDPNITCTQIDPSTKNPRYAQSYPKSDLNIWNESGNYKNNKIGLNFFSSYNLHPESFLFTSWVAGYYNDANVKKMIFDSYSIQNLLGINIYGSPSGGWLRFLQGINVRLKSYDEIINELFRIYTTKITPNLQPPPDPKCKIENQAAWWFKIIQTTSMGFGFGPEFAPLLGPIAFLYALTNTPKQDCPN